MGDQPGSKYCFAAGDMKVECEDDMEFTPTGGPRPTEGPEGNNGATDEGEEGPNGVTGGPDGGDNAGGVTGDGGSKCQCGLEGSRRIVGGEPSMSGKYPWIVAFNFGTTDGLQPGGCGATLIARNWVVTAAHCVNNRGVLSTKDDLSVILGEFDLSTLDDEFDTNRKNV